MTFVLRRLRWVLAMALSWVVAPVFVGPGATSAIAAERRLTLPEEQNPREEDSQTLRLLSWNVKAGAIFPANLPQPPDEEGGARVGSFGRILRAVCPDVVCLQEIWPRRRLSAVAILLNREFPLEDGQRWSIHRVTDLVIASRFPLTNKDGKLAIPFPLPGQPEFHYGHAMCLVDLPDDQFAVDLYVMTAHFKSRSGAESVAARERQADMMMRQLRDIRTVGSEVTVPKGTPLVIAGDFNVYESNADDPLRHLQTLLTGDVRDEQTFGPDFHPDWDATPLSDLLPRINGEGKHRYTWRNDSQPFPPGALDRIIYSDSVLQAKASFVLNTTELSEDTLARWGLRRTDSLFSARPGVFDHLPIVVDFTLKSLPKQ